jgi:glutathione peroxidase
MTQALSREHASKLAESSISNLEGQASSLAKFRNKALLLVNVASKCGNTPQYEKLEAIQKKYAERGFSIVGFPCNQFGGQEPGNAQEIRAFCTSSYGVTFPMMEKIEVNGAGRHPIYER